MEKTFEQAYQEFEEIVKKLQNEDVAIDEAVELFKQGIVLKKICQEILDDAENNITKLIDENRNESDFTHDKQ